MKLLVAALFITFSGNGQLNTSKSLRAFPITDYVLDLNDSVKVVQVELPGGTRLSEKQLGVLRGTYQTSASDTIEKGYGRCYLIKGNYFYFAIGNNKSGTSPRKGDLVYTMMDQPVVYPGRMPKLAAHFILLKNVYEKPLFDRFLVFQTWNKEIELTTIDSMLADIRFTGKYFQANDSSMDKRIQSGSFKGRKVLQTMIDCERSWVEDFLDYVIARPRLYAGREWMVSEIFATWLSSGAPKVAFQ